MRKIAFILVATCLCQGQTPVDVSPRIGLIEIFGERKASLAKIGTAIGAKVGDPLPASEAAEDRINKVAGVAASRIVATCCANNGKMILYVGIEERDMPHLELHPAPSGEARLPTVLYDDYLRFLEAVEGSIRGRNADEDLTNGYSLMADPASRSQQKEFLPQVENYLTLLDQVVRESSDPEQRAAAVYLLPYGPRGRKAKVITDALQWALRDQEDIVRKNALQALRAVYIGAKMHPDQDVPVETAWLTEMLNSVVWSDRRSAAQILVDLTEDRKQDILNTIREKALPSVLDMARWQTLDHALPAVVLAGRMAGADEKAIKDAWVREDRESILSELETGKKNKKGK